MVDRLTKSILVVEDNAIIREGLAVILRENGYLVVTAENGFRALSELQGASSRT